MNAVSSRRYQASCRGDGVTRAALALICAGVSVGEIPTTAAAMVTSARAVPAPPGSTSAATRAATSAATSAAAGPATADLRGEAVPDMRPPDSVVPSTVGSDLEECQCLRRPIPGTGARHGRRLGRLGHLHRGPDGGRAEL